MTAEEFERRYHFKPSDIVLNNINKELGEEAKAWGEKFEAMAKHERPSYHCTALRSGDNLTYEFCNKKLQDDISNQSFIFDIDGQLIYIDMEE